MRIQLVSYADRGKLSDERVGLRVVKPCNLKYFVVYHTKRTKGGFYNRPEHVLWFAPCDVQPGDEIVIYTKAGKDKTDFKDGRTIYFIYWGLDEPILNPEDCLVLSELNDWSVTTFEETEKE